jgi:environmental stress-induced protein Ves
MDYGVRVLRFAEYPVVPWRNGRGITREIAASAVAVARADADDAGPAVPSASPSWRISMATVDDEVPFSSFPGLRRMLGVVDGEGIELTVDGRMRVLRRGETFGPFAGEAPASARPLDGPTLDLGLMIDPGRVRGDMRAVGAGEHDLVGLIWFVVSLVDGLDLGLNGSPAATLARRDTAALDLRTGPIARLSLSVAAGVAGAGAANVHPAAAATTVAASPLAYLISVSH